MVSVVNGSSERAVFLFGGDRLVYVIGLSFSYVSVGYSSFADRGTRARRILSRGEGKAVLHNRPRHDVKRPCPGTP